MLRKVKQKAYKSKREFKDDLNLIWDNCFAYNAAEVRSLHPHNATVTAYLSPFLHSSRTIHFASVHLDSAPKPTSC
jgi:hypothetical protein